MSNSQDWINALEETSRNLKQQSQGLRQQSVDLSKESARILAAVRKARRNKDNTDSSKKAR
jgi:hypothetical protein